MPRIATAIGAGGGTPGWRDRAADPQIRRGSYFPSFLQPRKRSEQALLSLVQQAYACGVSTRRVDGLVESLGLRVSRSEVSRICAGLDEQVEAFRSRPLEAENLAAARDKLSEAVATLEGTLPKVASVLETAEEDILAFYAFRPTTGASQKHQPTGALQPRDRPAHRRRRDLPRRRLIDPTRHHARDRTER